MKKPNENFDEETPEVDSEVREFVEQMPGYQEYQKEIRGDGLTFGDF